MSMSLNGFEFWESNCLKLWIILSLSTYSTNSARSEQMEWMCEQSENYGAKTVIWCPWLTAQTQTIIMGKKWCRTKRSKKKIRKMKNVKRNIYDLNFIAIKAVSCLNINVSHFMSRKMSHYCILHQVFAIYLLFLLDATNVHHSLCYVRVLWCNTRVPYKIRRCHLSHNCIHTK